VREWVSGWVGGSVFISIRMCIRLTQRQDRGQASFGAVVNKENIETRMPLVV